MSRNNNSFKTINYRICLTLLIIFVLPLYLLPALARAEQRVDSFGAPQEGEVKGDTERGKQVFLRCMACHSMNNEDYPTSNQTKLGPDLDNLFGRQAGSHPDYQNYSLALKNAGFKWSEDRLDQWLQNPNAFLPGNTMAFAGLLRIEDRQNLLAYLRANSNTPPAETKSDANINDIED